MLIRLSRVVGWHTLSIGLEQFIELIQFLKRYSGYIGCNRVTGFGWRSTDTGGGLFHLIPEKYSSKEKGNDGIAKKIPSSGSFVVHGFNSSNGYAGNMR